MINYGDVDIGIITVLFHWISNRNKRDMHVGKNNLLHGADICLCFETLLHLENMENFHVNI